MIQGLFDEIEEENPPTEIEEINRSEPRSEPVILSEDEISLEIPDFTETENPIETPIARSSEAADIPPKSEPLFQPETPPIIDRPTEYSEIPTSFQSPPIGEPIIESDIPNRNEPPIFAGRSVEPMLFQTSHKPESTADTARKSGLAMSAAIALFGSVVFLLIIGWFADLLLGTSPWGIVGGIVLGSIVGFFQFFRMTSQILKNKDQY